MQTLRAGDILAFGIREQGRRLNDHKVRSWPNMAQPGQEEGLAAVAEIWAGAEPSLFRCKLIEILAPSKHRGTPPHAEEGPNAAATKGHTPHSVQSRCSVSRLRVPRAGAPWRVPSGAATGAELEEKRVLPWSPRPGLWTNREPLWVFTSCTRLLCLVLPLGC